MARICVIRQGYFPLDPRVRREVVALTMLGNEVDVVCIPHAGEPRYERMGAITIYRLPLRHRREGAAGYVFSYASFLVAALVVAAALHARRRYDLVQVHSLPDVLVFASLVPKLFGSRVILDLHECMPEFFATKYGTELDHPLVRVMARLEQASIRFADFVITCTDQMREAFVARGAPADKIGVVLNSADESVFDPERFPPASRRPGIFTLICHGSVETRYGLDTAIRAVALLQNEIPELRLEIYGDGNQLPELENLATALGVEDRVYFSREWVPIDQLLEAISLADAGIVGMKRDAFRDLTHCNKMYDLITMRKPVIISRTRSVQAYFDESSFLMFDSDDEYDLARAIRELHGDLGLSQTLVERAAASLEPYRWLRQRELYQSFVQKLLDTRRGDLLSGRKAAGQSGVGSGLASDSAVPQSLEERVGG